MVKTMKIYLSKYLNIFGFFLIFISYFSTITFYFSTTFYKEIFSVFGILILLLVLYFEDRIYINKGVIASFIIIFIPIIQYMLGLIYFFQDALFSAIYLLIFILSVFIGSNYRINKQKNLLNLFLVMLVFSGVVSVFVALNQRFIWVISDLLFPATHGNRATANLAQPNQLSTLLITSLISLFYLYQVKNFKKIIMYSIAFILLVGIVMTQSRTAWLSCIVLSGLYLLNFNKKNDFINIIKLHIIFFGLVLFLPFLLNILLNTHSSTVINRLQDGSTRFKIWPQLIHAALERPWTGYGWGQVGVAQLSTMNIQSTQGEWFTYSHNLFLDMMLWNGVIIGSLLNILIIYVLYRCYINLNSKQDLLLFLGFMAFFIHSCLEYPYAYTYFLIPSGIFLGYVSHQEKN